MKSFSGTINVDSIFRTPPNQSPARVSNNEAVSIYRKILGGLCPPAVLGLVMFKPCMPPLLLSLSPNCANIRSFLAWELWLVLFEVWIAAELLIVGTFWTLFVLFAGITGLLSYFQYFDRYVNTFNLIDRRLLIKMVAFFDKSGNQCRQTPRIIDFNH